MAAGVKNGKLTLTSSAQTLDALVGDTSTYSYISLRKLGGNAMIGAAAVTQVNGFQVPDGREVVINVSVAGNLIGLIGPGSVDFFGIATA